MFKSVKSLAVLAALCVGLSFAAASFAAPKVNTKDMIHGTIVSIADDKTSIVVATGGKKNPQQVTVTVDASTVVKINGEAKTLADLKPEQHVNISPATGKATEIDVVTAGGRHPNAPGGAPSTAPTAQ